MGGLQCCQSQTASTAEEIPIEQNDSNGVQLDGQGPPQTTVAGSPALVSDDQIFSDIDDAELKIFSSAFETFDPVEGLVGFDHMLLRAYICEHTCITEDSLDIILFQQEEGEGAQPALSLPAFSGIMRSFAIHDREMAQGWATISDGSDSVASPDARTGLVMMASDESVEVSEQQMDRMLNGVMAAAGPVVGREEWCTYAVHVARCLRAMRLR
mmetsp:Transcript_46317/g.105605  ORF Transcript_46317/g.105605 Transcript_46317/m.105605 type:complete len:213 (+) Transcript_46317:15-653(+)|eukprot:CAMPEP_0204350106 /NCGR_PEP_ID=MMETSP0469-20131031/30057_1 /ASSEMBLY_ACC=CAM_ASM_000384 /TAXON_ID=2969 /ORGANISM="Oxyrrhis marina" /LENGTH=212 /DNA_ID=CAMNT_0051336399 /DNA_START=1 /DNA_END=639 /DNA_ORIENTATION=+